MNKQTTNPYPHSSSTACNEVEYEYNERIIDTSAFTNKRLDKLEECVKKNLCPKCKDRLKCLTKR